MFDVKRTSWSVSLAFVLTIAGIGPTFDQEKAYAAAQLDDVSVKVIASRDSVEILWSGMDSGTLKIADGNSGEVFSTQSSSGSIQDESVTPGELANYTFEHSTPVNPKDPLAIDRIENLEEGANAADYDEVSIENIKLQIPSSLGFVSQESAVAEASPSATTLKYMTFIRDEIVWTPKNFGCPFPLWAYFLGDNRSFDATSEKFRTRVFVRVDWLNGGQVTHTATAGTSVVYVVPGALAFVSKASVDNIKVFTLATSETQSKFRISHRAADPLCLTANLFDYSVAYEYDVTVQKSGGYGLEGYAKRVPNHEAYIRDSNSPAWKTVLRRESASFDCLTAVLEDKNDACRTNTSYSGQVY